MRETSDTRAVPGKESLHAVILDIDGTLLHSFADDDRLYREAVTTVLGPVRFREMADYEHVSDSGILQEVFRDNGLRPDAAAVESIRRTFFGALEAHIARCGPFEEIPGARCFLERLRRSSRHACAIATGSWRTSALLKLRTAGFDVAGIPVATSDDATSRSDILRHALRALDGPIAEITYYGDGVWDRATCEALGWRFCGVGSTLGGITSFDAEFREELETSV